VDGEGWRGIIAQRGRVPRLGPADLSEDRDEELARLARFAAAGDRRALEQFVGATQGTCGGLVRISQIGPELRTLRRRHFCGRYPA
jgi:hypothetical protein